MIRIDQLDFAVGSFALKDVSLHVRPGEYFVLLGPTGSGKTLLVEALCGLSRIDSGRISLGGIDVTYLEPRLRNIGYVPQDYALFPHKTVRANIHYGLRYRPLSVDDARQEVDRLMEQLGLSHLANRLPRNLSGGEKQRVALARALAIGPQVLLLDEPVSALDEQTRDRLCRLLKQLQRDTETTTVHVCHNFAEMLTVADRVGIIHEGRIVQVGTPQDVLERPVSTLVARFMQAGNIFRAKARGGDGSIPLTCLGDMQLRPAEVAVMVRPENIRVQRTPPHDMPPGTTVLEGSVAEIVHLGPTTNISVACGEDALLRISLGKREFRRLALNLSDRVHLAIAPDDVHVMSE